MSEISDLLLTLLLNQGAALLAGVLFFAALGVPLPATLLLLATGAFVRHGVLPVVWTVLAAWLGAVLGDASSYGLGRWGAHRLPERLTTGPAWQRASTLFVRWGASSVFVTRFLLTPLALPVNLLAGSTHFGFSRFLLAVVLGEAVWVALFVGLGYTFADRWEWLAQFAGDLVGVLLGVVVLGVGAFLLLRRAQRADEHSA
ncbi:MAG: VTT domain-containing protein [Hydrogenophaga sp.]|uniref:DedA family protein n=1 Tax=Hydrogenophaga sp. TaxID=1904254 RepID=UPI0027482138|nr:VTT domain-containing protein [Hydrogenophaga sp.]MDP2418330.1 VTT domain-containing protein [Hydrogenophaga sp.]MDZ4187233.1 VTT domain-containing protein [Hydrogenophaga sp.]